MSDVEETLARQLQAAGYGGGVVIQKLVRDHQMPQGEAEALVERIYGWKTSWPVRRRNTRIAIGTASGLAGIVTALVAHFVYRVDSGWVLAGNGGLAALGGVSVFRILILLGAYGGGSLLFGSKTKGVRGP